ncbi:MAG: hypothetical protein ACK2UW_05560 [Anaerolineales bacterium]
MTGAEKASQTSMSDSLRQRGLFRAARFTWLVIFVLILFLFLGMLNSSYRATFYSESVELSVDVIRNLISRRIFTTYLFGLRVVVVGFYILAAALIFLRRVWPKGSRDWIAWLVSVTLLLAVVSFTGEVRIDIIPEPWNNIYSTLQSILLFLLIPGLFNTLYLFPDGHVVPRWAHSVIYVVNGWLVLIFLSIDWIENLLPSASEFMWVISSIFIGTLILIGITSQVYRYFRVSTPLQRQQTKWVLASFLLQGLDVFYFLLPQGSENPLAERLSALLILHLQILLPALIPLAFLIAMLRYRLFDIDLIIRRTLVYGTLTIALGLLFLLLVTGLQRLFVALTNQQSAISIVLSTLAIAALFNPLRTRIQDFIDQRFYRKKYNTDQTLAKLAHHVQNETDLEILANILMNTLSATIEPEFISLWIAAEKEE